MVFAILYIFVFLKNSTILTCRDNVKNKDVMKNDKLEVRYLLRQRSQQ